MKKFLITLCLIVFGVVFITGCSSSNTPKLPDKVKNGEWIEIQSITYFTNSAQYVTTQQVSTATTLKSECVMDVNQETISKSEYENAPKEQKNDIYYRYDKSIPVNRKEYITELNQQIGLTCYCDNYIGGDYVYYYRYVINDYELQYVRVRLLDNNCLEINYFVNSDKQGYTTIRVYPFSYTITYFND